jgi:hypothetical protein
MFAMLAAESVEWQERAAKMFVRLTGQARELAEREGIRVQAASRAGFAGRQIVEYATATHCDRIIIGRSHEGRFWQAIFSVYRRRRAAVREGSRDRRSESWLARGKLATLSKPRAVEVPIKRSDRQCRSRPPRHPTAISE